MPQLPPLPLQNAVAVVTGAAGGIGGAIAQNLARRGCHLALADSKAEPLAASAQSARAAGVTVSEHVFDISSSAAIADFQQAVAAQHNRVTVLVNCAGVALGGTFSQVTLEEFEWLFNINFWSVVRMTKAFLPMLEREPQAQIVNISSVFGLIGPPGQSAYAASKFAVRGFSEVLRHEMEVEKRNIGVTVVHPGGVRTGIAKNARRAAALTDAEIARMQRIWSQQLLSSPEPVAAAIVAGLERRRPRVLCGSGSTRIDIVQRLMPASYWKLMRLKVQSKGN